MGAYYARENKSVNIFLETAKAFMGEKSYDQSNWASKIQYRLGTLLVDINVFFIKYLVHGYFYVTLLFWVFHSIFWIDRGAKGNYSQNLLTKCSQD